MDSIEGLGVSPENNMDHKLEPKSTGVCHLLRIPLELRDPIYRMLLTTPYGTDLGSKGVSLKFHLHPAILLVNKQISEEATRVLYHENNFVVFTTTGVNLLLDRVPQFSRLLITQIPRPVLRIEIAVANGSRVVADDPQTVVTTAEGIFSIISAIWVLGNHNIPSSDVRLDHADLRLTLDFHLKAKARYEVLSNLVLAPWDRVNGFKELVLTKNIEEQCANGFRCQIKMGLV